MVKAFLLINARIGKEHEAAENLEKLDCVDYAKPVYGVFDIVVETNAPTMNELRNNINWKIKRTDGIINYL